MAFFLLFVSSFSRRLSGSDANSQPPLQYIGGKGKYPLMLICVSPRIKNQYRRSQKPIAKPSPTMGLATQHALKWPHCDVTVARIRPNRNSLNEPLFPHIRAPLESISFKWNMGESSQVPQPTCFWKLSSQAGTQSVLFSPSILTASPRSVRVVILHL